MKICFKCKTIAIGNKAILCPNCDEPFSDYQTMKANLKQGKLKLKEQVTEEHVENIQKRIENIEERIKILKQ